MYEKKYETLVLNKKRKYIRVTLLRPLLLETIYGRNGVNIVPAINMSAPIMQYEILYNFISDFILSTSINAKGLYKLYVIALPIPSSAIDKKDNIFANRPSTPK